MFVGILQMYRECTKYTCVSLRVYVCVRVSTRNVQGDERQ